MSETQPAVDILPARAVLPEGKESSAQSFNRQRGKGRGKPDGGTP